VNIKDYLLAGNPQTNKVKLSRLARSRHTAIRCRVAENPATSVALLVALSIDQSVDVRMAVACNLRVPRSLLAYLANDQSPDMRYFLAGDYNLPTVLLHKLSQDENPYIACRAQKTLDKLGFLHSCKIASRLMLLLQKSAYSSKAVVVVPTITRGSIPTNRPLSITPMT